MKKKIWKKNSMKDKIIKNIILKNKKKNNILVLFKLLLYYNKFNLMT